MDLAKLPKRRRDWLEVFTLPAVQPRVMPGTCEACVWGKGDHICGRSIPDWGGYKIPQSEVRCIACGCPYSISPEYDVYGACPFCRKYLHKAVLNDATEKR